MIAEPYKGGDATKYTDLTKIGAVIGLRKNKSGETNGWRANLSESGTTVNFDGYNLVVTGSGKAVIEIRWNSDKLVCNPYFYNNTIYAFETNEVVKDQNSNKITINADSSVRNIYTIQFYKNNVEPDNWNFFKTDGSSISENVWLSVNVVQ